MNFKVLFILLFIGACGVKGDPSSPKDHKIPSLMENYPDIEVDKPVDEFRKR